MHYIPGQPMKSMFFITMAQSQGTEVTKNYTVMYISTDFPFHQKYKHAIIHLQKKNLILLAWELVSILKKKLCLREAGLWSRHPGVPCWNPILAPNSSFLLMQTWRGSKWWQVVGSCHPCREIWTELPAQSSGTVPAGGSTREEDQQMGAWWVCLS